MRREDPAARPRDPATGDTLGPASAKPAWRRWARARAATVDWAAAGRALRPAVTAHLEPLPAGTVVVLYAALGGEADIEAVATVPGLSHLRFGLTRTAADGSLTVHRFEAPRERHRFGFLQPRASAPVLAADAAVFVVPGLAFDHAGVRLGHGTGSFDRLAASLPAARWVGVTAAALVVAALPAEPHDLRVEAVLAG